MVGTIIFVAVAFIALLWIAIIVRRRSIQTYLLATGNQTRGTSSLSWPRGRGAPSIAVTNTDAVGVTRTVIKSVVSAGDSELLKKPAMVVYHPERANRDDYVLVGFGDIPSTWFRVDFARSSRAL